MPHMLIPGSHPQRTSEEEFIVGLKMEQIPSESLDMQWRRLKAFKHCVYDQAFSPSNKLASVSPHSIRYSKKKEREERTPCANLAPLQSLTKKKYRTICFIALTQRLYWPLHVSDQIGDRFKAWACSVTLHVSCISHGI
jgi:hypothetical protein